MRKTKYDWSKENVENAIKYSTSFCGAIKIITGKSKKSGSSIAFVKKLVAEYSINTSHFPEIHVRCSLSANGRIKRDKPNDNLLFCEGSSYGRTAIRSRFREISQPNICEICKIKDWMNLPLVLQMDHIDGNKENNRLNNLRWICPNCHSQTSTYCIGPKAKNLLEIDDSTLIQMRKTMTNGRIAVALGVTRNRVDHRFKSIKRRLSDGLQEQNTSGQVR